VPDALDLSGGVCPAFSLGDRMGAGLAKPKEEDDSLDHGFRMLHEDQKETQPRPPAWRRALVSCGIGCLLGFLLVLVLPFVEGTAVSPPEILFGLLLGGLAGPLVEVTTHGVRGWGRRVFLGYATTALPAALLVPLVVFGGGAFELASDHPTAAIVALAAILAGVVVGHAAFIRYRAHHPVGIHTGTGGDDASIPRRWLWILTGVAGLLLVGWGSYAQPQTVSLHFLYLAPTSLVAWAIGRWGGMAMAIVAMNTHTMTLGMRHADRPMGTEEWLLLDSYILLGGLLVGANLVASLRSHLRQESTAARHDALTGLPNRRGFLEAAEAELSRATRHRTPFALAYIDLDGFKAVNDHRGHAVGDEVLREVGRTLRGQTRAHDLAARIGGDEFAILLPETRVEEARLSLETLRNRLGAAMAAGDWPITFSVGAIAGVADHADPRPLMAEADALMYRVKRSGKDRVAVEPRASGAPGDDGLAAVLADDPPPRRGRSPSLR
jgi:diguanylate cyclase (GGDEF)-like protein